MADLNADGEPLPVALPDVALPLPPPVHRPPGDEDPTQSGDAVEGLVAPPPVHRSVIR